MSWLRWIISTAVVLALIWAGYWAVAIYALDRAVADCGNELLQEATSTDGQYIATVFERNCGATAPFMRIVSVRPRVNRFDADNRDEWGWWARGPPGRDLVRSLYLIRVARARKGRCPPFFGSKVEHEGFFIEQWNEYFGR